MKQIYSTLEITETTSIKQGYTSTNFVEKCYVWVWIIIYGRKKICKKFFSIVAQTNVI